MSNFYWLSHFSGCGGSTLGAIASGFIPLLGIECDPKVASLYSTNIKSALVVDDIRRTTPQDLINADVPLRRSNGDILVLQTSPPCQDFSRANTKQNRESDRANIIRETFWQYDLLKPEYVVLENVRAYGKSEQYKEFEQFLINLGYSVWNGVLNSANFGVPQTRERFIMIATKPGWKVPAIQETHEEYPIGQLSLFGSTKQKWIGWYEAIFDLLEQMQNTELTEAQVQSLKKRNELIDNSAFLVSNQFLNRNGKLTVLPQSPCPTLTAIRPPFEAFLIERIGYYQAPKTRIASQPCWTMRSHLANDGKNSQRADIIDAVLRNGVAKKLNTLALARLQSFPDSYQWSDSFKLNVHGIGNSVPPLLMQRICESIKAAND